MTDSIDPAILDALRRAGLDPALVADLVDRALAEDLAGGPDVTTAATVPAGQPDGPRRCRARRACWPAWRWRPTSSRRWGRAG